MAMRIISQPSANAFPIAIKAEVPEVYSGVQSTVITTANIVAKTANVHDAIFLIFSELSLT